MNQEVFFTTFSTATATEIVNPNIIKNNNEEQIFDTHAKVFKVNFLKSGVVGGYNDGEETYNIFLLPEHLDKMVETWRGSPIIITHNGEESKGFLTEPFIEEVAGEKWICGHFATDDKETINLLNNGYQVSCAYSPLETNNINTIHDGINCRYDVSKIKSRHIAVVNDPRYERAKAILMNSKNSNSNNLSKKDMGLFTKSTKDVKSKVMQNEAEMPEKKEGKEAEVKENNCFKFYKKNSEQEEKENDAYETVDGMEAIPLEEIKDISVDGEVVLVKDLMEHIAELEREEASEDSNKEETQNTMSENEANKILVEGSRNTYNLLDIAKNFLAMKKNVESDEEVENESDESKEEEKKEEEIKNNKIALKPLKTFFVNSINNALSNPDSAEVKALQNAKINNNTTEKNNPALAMSAADVKNKLRGVKS